MSFINSTHLGSLFVSVIWIWSYLWKSLQLILKAINFHYIFVDSMRCLTSRRTPHPPPSPTCHKPPPWIYQRSFILKRSQCQEGLGYQVKDFWAGPLLWQKLKIWCTALLMLPISILTCMFLEWAPVLTVIMLRKCQSLESHLF